MGSKGDGLKKPKQDKATKEPAKTDTKGKGGEKEKDEKDAKKGKK